VLPRRVRCAVIGMGALGSAAAFRLARRLGDEVLVLEQFQPGHTRGASEDHSRLIRHSYPSTVYTRLTPAMFAAWREVEAVGGSSLITTTGGLDIGDPRVPGSVEAIEDNAAALADRGIGFEMLAAHELRARWPQWRVADDVRAVFQPDGGSLDIGRACATHLELARRCGARLYAQTRVLRLEAASDGGGVRLHTDSGAVETDDLVVCAGKWTNRVLGDLGQLPLTYTREQVTYFVPPSPADFAPERFPIWVRPGEPYFYGLGTHGVTAIKAAEDLGGPRVEVDDEESPTSARREQRLAAFLAEHLPGAVGPVAFSRACLYELTADRAFILGPLPGAPRVRVAIGAGHAAKFAALFGIVLSEMALDGESRHPVAPFRVDRPGL
jgi:monomeric sarcosine oxidase